MRNSTQKNEELIMAIDSGTQSIRAALVNYSGEITDLVKNEIEPYYSERPGWTEQNPEYYWEMLCKTCKALLHKTDRHKETIKAVTITTQRGTMINLNKDGKPLRPAIVWLDQRKADIRRVLPPIGYPIIKAVSLYGLVKFAIQYCRSNWIMQNQPEIWDKTHKYLFLSGYFTFKMTGEYNDSVGNIIGAIPFNTKKFRWAHRLDPKSWLFPVDREKLSTLVNPTEQLGVITHEAAKETGIPKGLPLVAASNDKGCEVIGSGCLTPDTACLSFGTLATINTQSEKYVELKPAMPPYPSAIPGQYFSEVCVMRGFWMVSWFKEEFGHQERHEAMGTKVSPEQLLEKLIKDVPAGSMGLVLQPYWTPGPDIEQYTKGAVIGFGDLHTKGHLYRAIIEGLLYALKEGAELIEKKNKVPITKIRVSGGGSQSDSIVQIAADIFGLAVERPHTHETSLVGAAIDSAVGLGVFPDFQTAINAMTRVGKTFEPIKRNHEIYDGLYNKVYLKMYKRLLPLYKEIKDITGYPE